MQRPNLDLQQNKGAWQAGIYKEAETLDIIKDFGLFVSMIPTGLVTAAPPCSEGVPMNPFEIAIFIDTLLYHNWKWTYNFFLIWLGICTGTICLYQPFKLGAYYFWFRSLYILLDNYISKTETEAKIDWSLHYIIFIIPRVWWSTRLLDWVYIQPLPVEML